MMGKSKHKNAVVWMSVHAFLISNVVSEAVKPHSPTDSNDGGAISSKSEFDVEKAYAAAVAFEDDVEITITAIEMRDASNALRADPMCVTYMKPLTTNDWTEYHRTEISWNLTHAKFVRKVVLPHLAGSKERALRFALYSADEASSNGEILDTKNCLGYAEANLDELIEAGEKELPLLRGPNAKPTRGRMIIQAEKLIRNDTKIVLQFTGPRQLLGKPNFYMEVYKETKIREYALSWRTEVIHGKSQPKWNPMIIPLRSLCNGDYNRSLKFVCWDFQENKLSDIFVGEFETTLATLGERKLNRKTAFRLTDPGKNSSAGNVELVRLDAVHVETFANVIKGGRRIHSTVAIDFSSSNGDPRQSGTLHYREEKDGTLNRYQEAIISGITVLENYDWDKKFPVYGFGARNPITGSICENFKISPDSPDCVGLQGVLEAYEKHLSGMEFSWDTNFAPIIRVAVDTAKAFESHLDYYLLLILTTGVISDFERTESVLVEASQLPISIIIVGIGNSSFENMKKLADGTRSVGKTSDGARRDIVHFISYNELRKFNFFNLEEAVLFLSRELLAKVPDQVASHWMIRNRVEGPNPIEYLRSSL